MILTDSNFEASLKRCENLVLLFFTSSACGPSYAMQLIIDDEAETIEQQYEIAEIDIESCPVITRHFQIKGTPTLMVIYKGEPLASRIGTQTPKQLLEWLSAAAALTP